LTKPIQLAPLCAAVAAFLLWTACTSHSVKADASLKPEGSRKPAPEFTLKDSNGQTVHLADYKGKVVLLDFWATWCGPCKIEIPWFMEFEQQLKDRGFAVVGVSMDEDGWNVVKPYIQQYKVNYRILLGNDQVGEIYGGVESLPTTFIIDRQGKIASVHIGLSGKDEFKNAITQLLDTPRSASLAPLGANFAFFKSAR
jgi:peroxiredoxin